MSEKDKDSERIRQACACVVFMNVCMMSVPSQIWMDVCIERKDGAVR